MQVVQLVYLDALTQEDNATTHASRHQEVYFNAADVCRILWPGNSPDLNMIEPCWAYLKRKTTRKGALTSRAHAEQQWLKAWEELPQWRIQVWIERIPRHIQEVIKDKGGNDY